jgi:hypothetical protein
VTLFLPPVSESIKAKNIHRNKGVSICIDDQIPPFLFVTIFGTAKIFPILCQLKALTDIKGLLGIITCYKDLIEGVKKYNINS